MESKIVTDKELGQKIIKLYNSGISQDVLSREYHVSKKILRRFLVDNEISIRDHSHKKRKYTLNENYFDKIDTPNKAYILGLLFADGCNSGNKTHTVSIALQERDTKILTLINKELESNRPIATRMLHEKNPNWQNSCLLSITNKHMSDTLDSLGMMQNKSLILQFPEYLEKDLVRHFIRGYFDGDGCIQWGVSNFITLASTKEFCESVNKICEEELGIRGSILFTYNKESNTRILDICGKVKVYKFLDFIYHDAELYIKRKYEKYLMICDVLIQKDKQSLLA